MNHKRIPVEAFPPSEFIREEMQARGWTVEKLAEQMVIPVREVEGLLNDTTPLTARYAERLSVAFGSSAIYWSNLWMAWKKYGTEGK